MLSSYIVERARKGALEVVWKGGSNAFRHFNRQQRIIHVGSRREGGFRTTFRSLPIRGQGTLSNVSIDTSGKFQSHEIQGPFTPHPLKEAPTPLTKEIASRIKIKGPITISEFMFLALQHPEHGYYTSKGDKIGERGDFTTSPEISQMFGELISVWFYSVWESIGKPSSVHLVEMGPGNGTLMADLLRASESFPSFNEALSVHLVESSPNLKRVQQLTLERNNVSGRGMVPRIQWHSSLDTIPEGPTLVLAQELLDALPVHQFEYTTKGWRERLVDVNELDEGPHHLRLVLSPNETPAVKALLQGKNSSFSVMTESQLGLEVGDCIEACPAGLAVVDDICRRVHQHGGGALIIDYGHPNAQQDTLRAYKDHNEVHVFDSPGMSDLTADVDFGAVKRVADAAEASIRKGQWGKGHGIKGHGPVNQGTFLQAMGIGERAGMLIDQDRVDDDTAQVIYDGLIRLVAPDQMGDRYKVLAMTNGQVPSPPGFPAF